VPPKHYEVGPLRRRTRWLLIFTACGWIVWICATAVTGHPSRLRIPFVALLALYYKQLRAPYGIDVFENGDIMEI